MSSQTPPTGWFCTARRVKNCPIDVKVGDRMLVTLPGLSKEESEPICALALLDLVPVIQKLEKAREGGKEATGAKGGKTPADLGVGNFCTGCKAQNAFVEFDITRHFVVSLGDSGKFLDPTFIDSFKTLKEFKLFSPLPTRSLMRMLPTVHEKIMPDREFVMKKGGRGEYLYLLAKGEVEVVTTDQNNVETVIATLGRGEVIGEMSLLTGEPVAATIRCKGEVKFYTIEKHDFERLLAANPALNLYFTKLLAERLKNTSKRFMTEIEKGVLGYLNMIAPPELIQALEGTARSGLLTAREGDKTIEMYLHDGRLYRITSGGKMTKDPEEAFFDFLEWKNGTFRFEPGERDEKQTFFKETTALLLEGMRRVDEAQGAPPP